MQRRTVTAVITTALLAGGGVATALAATKNGITPVSPTGTIKAGKRPTFKAKVTEPGSVWVHVCKSKRVDSEGVICSTESIGQAHKKDGVFTYRPKLYTYPTYWLQRRGTYYWQVHRIQCEEDLDDCRQEGPIVRIKVV